MPKLAQALPSTLTGMVFTWQMLCRRKHAIFWNILLNCFLSSQEYFMKQVLLISILSQAIKIMLGWGLVSISVTLVSICLRKFICALLSCFDLIKEHFLFGCYSLESAFYFMPMVGFFPAFLVFQLKVWVWQELLCIMHILGLPVVPRYSLKLEGALQWESWHVVFYGQRSLFRRVSFSLVSFWYLVIRETDGAKIVRTRVTSKLET